MPPEHKSIIDMNLNQSSFNHLITLGAVPELKQLVLSVCHETIPPEMKFAGHIDYYNIMNNIAIPFFEKETRILKENNFFSIDKTFFKVISATPCAGRVTNNTAIYCSRYHHLSCLELLVKHD